MKEKFSKDKGKIEKQKRNQFNEKKLHKPKHQDSQNLPAAKNLEQPNDPFVIVGRRAVLESFDSDIVIEKLCIRSGEVEGSLKVILSKAQEKGIFVQQMPRQKLDELAEGCVHQGVIALCATQEYVELEDILEYAAKKGEKPFIIILDQITDPHNFGAIIRTADAAGVHGIVIGKRRSVGLTPIVSKTSAGAVSYVRVARVNNITNAILELKNAGLFIAAADLEGENMHSAPIDGAIALVIGSEGSGVSRLVREKCDFSVKIPMFGAISSLNASVAASVLMYEVVRRRLNSEASYGKDL